MDDAAVREQAQAFCDALLAGDVDRAIEFMSAELHRNLGEVIALLPLPATETAIESVEAGGAGYNVVLRLVGESETVLIQTRWKDRDGTPTIIEASHLSKTPTAPPDVAGESEAENPGLTGLGRAPRGLEGREAPSSQLRGQLRARRGRLCQIPSGAALWSDFDHKGPWGLGPKHRSCV